MALGVLAALMERGRRIPQDVSVAGFDNIEEARSASPPLTTVRQPLYEQGRRAAEMLLNLLAGKDVPDQVTLPTELIIRRSCGCLSPVTSGLTNVFDINAGSKLNSSGVGSRKQVLASLQAAAGPVSEDIAPGWASRLLDAFLDTLKKPSKGSFLYDLDGILRQLCIKGHDVTQWQDLLPILRLHALAVHHTGSWTTSEVDTLLQRALAMIIEVALWAQAYRRIQSERSALDFNTMISEPLMTAFDIAGLTDVVASQLPQMGI